MLICGYFHLFPKEHNAGSETTVHAALRAMVQRGHKVNVVCDRSITAPYVIDGINVVRPPRRGQQTWLQEYVKECDLLVTHLDLTSLAMSLAADVNKPLAHFVHNSAQLDYWHVKERKCELAIFNSDWVAKAEKWQGDQITIHPVVEAEYYRCSRGESVTLANPTAGKGANTFYALASQMPNVNFLTAQGGYGIQMSCPKGMGGTKHSFFDDRGAEIPCVGLHNVTHLKNDPDIRNVFRKTKVLLMPSEYESYGRVGVEAACAGIPTIAHPTPGLTEAFGDAGIFIDRNDIAAWYLEIDRLLKDEVYYRKRSDMVLNLAETLDPESEFDRLEDALLVTVSKWQGREKDTMNRMWTSDRRLYKKADGSITENKNEAQSLYVGEGGEIPEEEAISLGLVSRPAIQTEPLLDTKALTAPSENKAIQAPRQIKQRKPRARKTA